MKTSSALLMAALVASTIIAGAVFASPPSGETKSPGQPFEHPSDDMSYSKDMRDDEILAKSKAADNGKARYISGGIAVSGMRAIDAEESLYNLKMLFVSKGKYSAGEYLADVSVHITDSKGKNVLNTNAKGPVLLVKMPPGHYTVSAKAEDRSMLTRKVTVGDDYLASYVLRYPAKEQ